MGMSAGGGRGGIKSDINVTPLVDVVLVLLIIFMVVTPMMQQGQPVALPRAVQVDKEAKDTPLVLSMTPDHQLFVDAQGYTDEAAFKGRLLSELGQKPDRRILLKADQSLSCGDVQKVIKLARAAGAERVSFGVQAPETN